MAKRTGLGRGIGALIPTSESAEARPVDVFFPGASTPAARAAARAMTRSMSERLYRCAFVPGWGTLRMAPLLT